MLALCALAAGIGVVSAFVATALVWLINLFTNLSFAHRLSARPAVTLLPHSPLTVLLAPVIGGLVIGFMAKYGSEKIRGHGIPEALEAILIGRSRIQAKVALLKPLSSAISIGTGGPFGAEGPIIMTGGAFGSIAARFFHLSAAERKTLLVAGAAGGMAAIFSAPVAAVLLAVELLLFEWKPRSFIPVACASLTAAALRVPLMGHGPVFPIHAHGEPSMTVLAIAVIVGLIAGLASGALTTLVYFFEDLFHRLPIHWCWWPAIGGVAIGIGGLIDPRVLGVGYSSIHAILSGQVVGATLLGLVIAKAMVWSIALGSGTSGGVLAPLLMMGAALGAYEARWIPAGDVSLWASVSMAAIMAGTMRSPLTALVFSVELTHDFALLPALLAACVAGELVTVLLLKRSILTEKVARRGHHLVREYAVDPFEIHRVGEIMVPRPAEATPEMCCVYADDPVREAVVKLLENDIAELSVADPATDEIVGMVDRASVLDARRRWYEEEHLRTRTWKPSRRLRKAAARIGIGVSREA